MAMFMKKKFKRLIQILFIYWFSSGFYLFIEQIYKFGTDKPPSIECAVLAGLIGVMASLINNIFSYDMDLLLQAGICATFATIGEGIVGTIFNANYQMWDYRHLWGSFWNGNCNVFFCIAWLFLSMIIIVACDYIEWRLFDYKPMIQPYYVIFGKVRFQFKRHHCSI